MFGACLVIHPLSKRLAVAVAVVAVVLTWATPVFTNALMLLMDRMNFIPGESSIWTFKPYEINQGSSNYWLYGEDSHSYYHFAYIPNAPYRSISKSNQCAGFDKRDVRTWCTP